MIGARAATLLNFSGNSYHWGCFGTSLEIYQSLIERNYYVTYLGTEETHLFSQTPQDLAQLTDTDFMRRALEDNTVLRVHLQQADIVVVNGEGTLHGPQAGARNLLFFMALASRYLGKKVHLINHCFYPSDDLQANAVQDELYGTVAAGLTQVVPRDALSLRELHRLKIRATQGFDCLPRFIARHAIRPPLLRRGLMLSGGVKMADTMAQQIAAQVAKRRKLLEPLRYLTGAKGFPANEDTPAYAAMRAGAPDLKLLQAASMTEWLEAIAGARCLISGRFHHSIAAIMFGTPIITFPSNTPKLSAICAMLGLEPPIAYDDPDCGGKLEAALDRLEQGKIPVIDKSMRRKLLSWAEENFAGL